MPWYIIFCVWFLSGFSITNAWLRHYVLTMIIWTCKGLRWCTKESFSGLIWLCEWTQDTFDDIDAMPIKHTIKPYQKIKHTMVEKPHAQQFDFAHATDDELQSYIRQQLKDHPDQVTVKRRGGD